MSLKKNEAIKEILADFEQLSNLVLSQLDNVDHMIDKGGLKIDDKLQHSIDKNERQIDKLEVKLSDKIVNTIVLYQPVASELRQIMACYRMVISLERISDHVVNITSYMKKLKTPEVFEELQEILHGMIKQSHRMVREALLSFINHDRDLAIWTLQNEMAFEETILKLTKKILRKSYTTDGNRKFLMSVIRIREVMTNIDRIADHGTNIAAASIYYLDGQNIRHRKISE